MFLENRAMRLFVIVRVVVPNGFRDEGRVVDESVGLIDYQLDVAFVAIARAVTRVEYAILEYRELVLVV